MPLSLSTLVGLLKATDSISAVIFYCGSSRGRGPRSAAWFQDQLDQEGVADITSYVLEGGIKGWVKRGRQQPETGFEGYVAGYESSYWDQFIDEN